MNHRRCLLVAVGLVFALVAGAVAEESKFSLSKYNPFAGKDSSTVKSGSARSNTTAKRPASGKKSSEPSAWQKFTSGTKATVNKLNPWSSEKAKPKKTASTKTGTNKPKTVSDFIKQPRPE